MAQVAKNNEIITIEYSLSNGDLMTLDSNTVKNYLVNGNGKITDQEALMFMNLCKFQHLNPFLKECYCIKYSDNDPATIVVGKEAFLKRAENNKHYRGKEDGIVVQKKDGTIDKRNGAIYMPENGETLIGGWAKVYRDGYEKPIETMVALNEYIGKKKDGTINANWSNRPATMIKKVALVQALRETFPQDFGGMYIEEEAKDENFEPTYTVTEPQEEPSEFQEAEINTGPTQSVEPDPIFETITNDNNETLGDCFEIFYSEYKNNKELYQPVKRAGNQPAYDDKTKKILVKRK